ncbi:MAG: hypothetical protein LBU07_05050 [Coriobacteriales bacterium]|jgi:hypothetical protein|nr:hypothetical protein [Coriobacteriales bacterium]
MEKKRFEDAKMVAGMFLFWYGLTILLTIAFFPITFFLIPLLWGFVPWFFFVWAIIPFVMYLHKKTLGY